MFDTASPAPSAPAEQQSRWGRLADTLSCGIVLAFAFLSASFVARNSDVWLHLASGRLLAAGEYRFGVDPFAYTTAGEYWVNHAWLFDLGLYLAFGRFGGAGLVAVKASLVAATAGLMLFAARGRGPRWLATGCILLAVLAMSSRLLLQPMVASLLLLAGCLCCLRAGGRALAAVPVLIAIWVNVDSWFLLGVALVALFWLGRLLDPARQMLPRWPVWLFPASVGACLLNPHHVYALRLPLELSPAVWFSAFHTDPRFAGLFASPWRWAPLGEAGGYSFAAWGFFLLLGLGAVSFVVNRSALRSWRLTVWVPFALLAAWQSRLIPFFAVVAGPILALNLCEVWPESRLVRGGRGLVFATAAALLGLSWLGWTNGIYNREHGTAWAVHADPTLVRAAEGVSSWRKQSAAPPEARLFPTHPDVGNYLAWFAPGEKYWLDSRLQLFTGVAADFTALSRLAGLLPDGADESPREQLGRHGIAAVLLYDPASGRMTRGLSGAATGRWEILRIDGGSVLLAPPGGGLGQPRFDAERQAFGGASELPVAGAGPAGLYEPAPWWRPTRERGRMGSWEADAATVYLRLAEAGGSKSPALPLLGIRAARVGLEKDPHDPTAWVALGRAYLLLGAQTWEREAGAGLTPLEHLRFIQATGALIQAARENPDFLPAHESLTGLFLRRNMIDLAHRHAVIVKRLVRRVGLLSGETGEAFEKRLGDVDAMVEAIEASLLDSQNRFLVRTAGLSGDPLARARIAGEMGLTQKAIDILAGSHFDLYGMDGVGLLADLLLQTGQIAECRQILDEKKLRNNPDGLGVYNLPRKANPDGTRWTYRLHAYDWLDLCQRAAAGRYPDAIAALDRLTARLGYEEQGATVPLTGGGVMLLASNVGFGVPPLPLAARMVNLKQELTLTAMLNQTRSLSLNRADLETLAGTLELERGDRQAASWRFGTALARYKTGASYPLSRPGEPLAARYDEEIRKTR